MEYGEYKKIYDSLNVPDDICRLEEEGYDQRLLDSLYCQKKSREAKKRDHIVRSKAPALLREWKKGQTLMEISERNKFPPILTSMIIFIQDGASKKQFWDFVRSPDLLESKQTADEMRDVIKNDIVYSPDANDRQKERGIWGETLLHDWLDKQGIKYKTETDLRGGVGQKTPDCLLENPVLYDGKKICWIESKASFGDNDEFRRNTHKQLEPYTHLFGPGLVIYWIGCLDDLQCQQDIYVSDISVLDKTLESLND
jgi:hypothetical protein